MNPIVFAMRRPITTLILVVALASGGLVGLAKLGVDLPAPLNTPKINAWADYVGVRAKQMKEYVVGKVESYFQKHEEEHHEEQRKVVVTSPKVMDVVITQRYVCQIHSQQHINVRAFDNGYLDKILVMEGQAVKKDDLMFKIRPILYQAKYDAEKAEAELAKLEYDFTKQLAENKVAGQPGGVVSPNEVLLFHAKLAKAQAKADLAQAELQFTDVIAPFDGIVDRLHEQLGSLIKEGDILTTLSDNRVMWVYFNVPERQYLEYMASSKQDLLLMPAVSGISRIPTEGKSLVIVAVADHVLHFRIFDGEGKMVIDTDEKRLTEQAQSLEDLRKQLNSLWPPRELAGSEKSRVIAAVTSIVGYTQGDQKIELELANHNTFPESCKNLRVEGQFNNETGNIAFRADFPNPDGLLRHGQTGTILIHRMLKNALVIPQRATFELLDKRYVKLVGEDGVADQRLITVKHELEDIFVIDSEVNAKDKVGLDVKDKLVLEGIREVEVGAKVEYEFRSPEEALDKKNQKFHAE